MLRTEDIKALYEALRGHGLENATEIERAIVEELTRDELVRVLPVVEQILLRAVRSTFFHGCNQMITPFGVIFSNCRCGYMIQNEQDFEAHVEAWALRPN